MKIIQLIIILYTLIILSACAGISENWGDPVESVDRLVTQEEYAQAMQIISSIDEKHRDYKTLQKKREIIVKDINRFENRFLAQQKTLRKKDYWPEAIEAADRALKKLPASQKIIAARKQTIIERDKYINEKRLSLAINQAGSLPGALTLLADIDQAKPGQKHSRQALLVVRGQSQRAHNILLSQASIEINNKNWITANNYLSMANTLLPNKETGRLLAMTHQQVNQQASKRNRAIKLQQENSKDDQLAKLNKSLQNNDYLQAQGIANNLKKWKSKDVQVANVLKQYHKNINSEIKTLTNKGQQSYTKGFIDKAIQYWNQALLLTPDNADIQGRLDRAVIFKTNINKFKHVASAP